MGAIMNKPTITKEQLIKSSEAAKNFGGLRRRSKQQPMFITENGNVDSVLMGYEQYEKMYLRLNELESKAETAILTQRIDRLEKSPELAVPWNKIRRTKNNVRKEI